MFARFLTIAAVALAGCASARVHTPQPVCLVMDGGTCSGTVIGSHAILTAEHCVTNEHTISMGGKTLTIRKTLRDGNDHVILLVTTQFDFRAVLGKAPV